MKLKNIFALVAFAAGIVGCDDIKENERFIAVETPETPEGPSVQQPKNVLVEDFTGMYCKNCPEAAAAVHEIQNHYGADRVISVAIHGDIPVLAGPLKNDLGTEYYNHWGVESLPTGMVDRNGGLQNYDKWLAAVTNRMNLKAPVSLTFKNTTYNADSRTLNLQIEALTDATFDAKLQVWITESNIKLPQSMPDGSLNPNYIHNHVLRDAVNGAWGEAVGFEAGVAQELTYEYAVSDKWVAENLAVVAFVYDASGVMQVIETPLFEDVEEGEPAPEVKPEFGFENEGAVLEDGATLILQAVNGEATTAANAFMLKNLGTTALAATATLEIVEDLTGMSYMLSAFGNSVDAQDGVASLEGEVAAGEAAVFNLSAVFAEGVYGTAKAKLTVTAGEVSKSIHLDFVNPAPEVPAVPFELVYNGTVLEDGATVNIAAIIHDYTEFIPDYYVVEAKTNDEANALNIRNLTGDVLPAVISVSVLEDVEGANYSLCSFGDCVSVRGGSASKEGQINAYAEAATAWDVAFTYGMPGTAKTKLTVTAGDMVQTVYVNFVYEQEEPAAKGPFQLVYNGSVLEDGATVDIAAIIHDYTEFIPDYYVVEAKTNDEANALNIRNLTGDVLPAVISVSVLEDVEGANYSLCSFGDCVNVRGGSASKEGQINALAEAATSWDVMFTYGSKGTAKTKLTVTAGDVEQTVYVNFVYE